MKTRTIVLCSKCEKEIKCGEGLILNGKLSTIPDREGLSENILKKWG